MVMSLSSCHNCPGDPSLEAHDISKISQRDHFLLNESSVWTLQCLDHKALSHIPTDAIVATVGMDHEVERFSAMLTKDKKSSKSPHNTIKVNKTCTTSSQNSPEDKPVGHDEESLVLIFSCQFRNELSKISRTPGSENWSLGGEKSLLMVITRLSMSHLSGGQGCPGLSLRTKLDSCTRHGRGKSVIQQQS